MHVIFMLSPILCGIYAGAQAKHLSFIFISLPKYKVKRWMAMDYGYA